MTMMAFSRARATYNDCKCEDQDVYFVYTEGDSFVLGPCLECFCEYNRLSRASTPEMK